MTRDCGHMQGMTRDCGQQKRDDQDCDTVQGYQNWGNMGGMTKRGNSQERPKNWGPRNTDHSQSVQPHAKPARERL
ncbi:unnamed protein product [Staurois parvus]|uniref:Uncharacterized protein n=1 Tax=Staurois parvus TaxID=386267 RepID=A0ABN9D3E1_9NEOB|nr:unnamed protein product [Staurois parvus]